MHREQWNGADDLTGRGRLLGGLGKYRRVAGASFEAGVPDRSEYIDIILRSLSVQKCGTSLMFLIYVAGCTDRIDRVTIVRPSSVEVTTLAANFQPYWKILRQQRTYGADGIY